MGIELPLQEEERRAANRSLDPPDAADHDDEDDGCCLECPTASLRKSSAGLPSFAEDASEHLGKAARRV